MSSPLPPPPPPPPRRPVSSTTTPVSTGAGTGHLSRAKVAIIAAVVVVAAAGYWWQNRSPSQHEPVSTAQIPTNSTSPPEAARSSSPSEFDLSSGAITAILEQTWNYYLSEKIFLGPTYFGNTTSFGRHGNSLHALALISDHPRYRALATKGLIKLEELSLSDAPPATSIARLDRAATVSLTQTGARFGDVDSKANTVTFVLGTYRIEKIESNTAIDTKVGNYRFVQGTHVFEPGKEFSDVLAELGMPTYRERRFRVLFNYDTTESKWRVAVANNGRFTAEDIGPRDGEFESANVPTTIESLSVSTKGQATPSNLRQVGAAAATATAAPILASSTLAAWRRGDWSAGTEKTMSPTLTSSTGSQVAGSVQILTLIASAPVRVKIVDETTGAVLLNSTTLDRREPKEFRKTGSLLITVEDRTKLQMWVDGRATEIPQFPNGNYGRFRLD